MTFQASNTKGRQFLDLLDNNLQPIKPLYSKEGLWLKYFSHFNLLYTRALRAIVNHTPIGEYCLYKKNLSACVDNILSKQDNIFSINIKGSTIIGISDKIQ